MTFIQEIRLRSNAQTSHEPALDDLNALLAELDRLRTVNKGLHEIIVALTPPPPSTQRRPLPL